LARLFAKIYEKVNLYTQSNPSVSHTLDSSPYTGEPLEGDFVNTLNPSCA